MASNGSSSRIGSGSVGYEKQSCATSEPPGSFADQARSGMDVRLTSEFTRSAARPCPAGLIATHKLHATARPVRRVSKDALLISALRAAYSLSRRAFAASHADAVVVFREPRSAAFFMLET